MNGGRFVMFGKNRTAQDTLGNDRELLRSLLKVLEILYMQKSLTR